MHRNSPGESWKPNGRKWSRKDLLQWISFFYRIHSAPSISGGNEDVSGFGCFPFDILGTQNHSMVGVGRNLHGSPSPTLLPKQGHLQQAAQDLVQVGLEYLQRRRLHSFPGQPVPGLHHLQREEVLPRVQLELPLLQFVPVAPCPVAGHYWKEFGPIHLTPTLEKARNLCKIYTKQFLNLCPAMNKSLFLAAQKK